MSSRGCSNINVETTTTTETIEDQPMNSYSFTNTYLNTVATTTNPKLVVAMDEISHFGKKRGRNATMTNPQTNETSEQGAKQGILIFIVKLFWD